MEFNRELTQLLKKVRVEKGLTASELSLITGIGQRGIYKVENGETDPKLSTILKLCKALGVKVSFSPEFSSIKELKV